MFKKSGLAALFLLGEIFMHWDRYWSATQGLSSFADMKSEIGYPEEVLTFWEEMIRSYNQNNLSIADLATGKGAIAVWLKTISVKIGINASVAACDGAKIDMATTNLTNPEYVNALGKVNFSFLTHLENLPYDDEQFDLVVSQFGFEYSDWKKSICEAIRVLKSEGKLVFMLHHKNSAITLDSQAGLFVLETVLKSGILNELKSVINLKLKGEEDKFTKRNSEIIAKLNSFPLQNELQATWYMDFMKKAAKSMQSMNHESLRKLATLEQSLITQIERSKDQINVALTEQAIRDKLVPFDDLLAINMLKEFNVEKQVFAWIVELSCK